MATVFEHYAESAQLWQANIPGHTHVNGEGALVLGYLGDGFKQTITGGAYLEIEQTADIDDVKSIRALGTVRYNEETPAGYEWQVYLSIDGNVAVLGEETDVAGIYESSLEALVVSTEGLAATGNVIRVGIRLAGPAAPVEVTLPTVIIEELQFSTDLGVAVDPILPTDGQTTANASSPVKFRVLSTDNSAVDLTSLMVYMNNVLVYDNGFIAPHSGSVGGSVTNVEFTLNVLADNPVYKLQSGDLNRVRVQASTDNGATVDHRYSYTIKDTQEPEVVSIEPLGGSLRVTFSEPLDESTIDADRFAVVPEQYGAPVQVVGVYKESETVYILELSDVPSFDTNYQLLISNELVDTSSNIFTDREIAFVSQSQKSKCKRTTLWEQVPHNNRERDVQGHLASLFKVLQDIHDSTLYTVDCFLDILDPDKAPPRFVDLMIEKLRLPLNIAALSLADKRKLVRVIPDIRKYQGTWAGVEGAIQYFLGIDAQVIPLWDAEGVWVVDQSLLGIDTTLAPEAGSRVFYTFVLKLNRDITDDERARILEIVRHFKPIHEHLNGPAGSAYEDGIITPSTPTAADIDGNLKYWTINTDGYGELGLTTRLSE